MECIKFAPQKERGRPTPPNPPFLRPCIGLLTYIVIIVCVQFEGHVYNELGSICHGCHLLLDNVWDMCGSLFPHGELVGRGVSGGWFPW